MLTEELPFQESANGIMKSTPSASSRHLPYQGRLLPFSAFLCFYLPFAKRLCTGFARAPGYGRPYGLYANV